MKGSRRYSAKDYDLLVSLPEVDAERKNEIQPIFMDGTFGKEL